jgi:hypothetical protein
VALRGGSPTGVANRAWMWKQDESGRVHTPLEPVVLGATLALIPVLIIEADATSAGWQDFATVANWIIWAIFATELAAVLVAAERKRAALRAHWLDVAIVVLTIPLLGKEPRHCDGAGTVPRLIDPEPQVGDTISFDGVLWSLEKVQAPTSPPRWAAYGPSATRPPKPSRRTPRRRVASTPRGVGSVSTA